MLKQSKVTMTVLELETLILNKVRRQHTNQTETVEQPVVTFLRPPGRVGVPEEIDIAEFSQIRIEYAEEID